MLRAISIIIHVVAAVLWIGGVGFVTTIVLPSAMRQEDAFKKAQILMSNAESFRRYALIYIGAVGVTGVVNLYFMGLPPLSSPLGLKVYLMIAIYVVLTALVLGMPKLLSRMVEGLSVDDMLVRVHRMHWIFLVLGLVAFADGVSIRAF